MRTSLVWVWGVLVTAVGTGAASAARANGPLALVSSGGVSQGAYQAGVTYAFIATQARRGRPIEVATGASAGNINSVLSAITRCGTEGAYHALANPFVDAWLNVGWDKLFPDQHHQDRRAYRQLFARELGTDAFVARARAFAASAGPGGSVYTDEDGAIARSAAFEVAEAHVIELLDRGAYRPGCRMRAGVTLTPVSPQTIRMDHASGSSTIVHQRTLVSFSLAARARGGLAVADLPLDDEKWADLSRKLSERAANGAGLLKLMKAGSAFPIAFAPIDLEGVIEGHPGESSRYSDGGVFDNVPLGLAQQLAQSSTAALVYYYSDPDLLRGQVRLPRLAPRVHDGTGTDFATYVGETRRHEIQTAMLQPDLEVRVLGRFHPIVSGEATTFGAFAHRDFRVHDYLIGLYDGLIGSSAYADTSTHTDVTFLADLRALTEPVPEKGAFLERRAVIEALLWLRHEELARRVGARRAHELCRRADEDRPRLVSTHCAQARPPKTLAHIFDYLAQLDRERRTAAASGDRWDEPSKLQILQNIAPEARVYAHSSELDADAHTWLRDTYDLVLARLRTIESADQDVLLKRPQLLGWDLDHVLGAVHPLLRGFVLRPTSPGPTMGSDSIPARGFADVLWHLVPYYASADVSMGGLHIGWRPQYRFASRFFASGAIDLHFPSLDPLGRVFLVRPRVGLGWVWFASADLRIPAVEIDMGVVSGDITQFEHTLGGEVLLTILGKLQLGAGLTMPVDDAERDTNLSQFLSLTIGVADLNGLLRGLLEVACW